MYYIKVLNLDLSEQDLLSCSGAGTCDGGYPSVALNYITNTGIVDEAAFPYAKANLPCSDKSKTAAELLQITGKIDFGSTAYPKTEDDLKRMLIEMGPVSGGLYDWSHAMVLVGYKVVKEGDQFYYQDSHGAHSWITILAGDPMIGQTVWLFKNSWGQLAGDAGYLYTLTPITNIGWTHALKTPVISRVQNYDVVCEDADGDGYYWWGLGPKPANCPGPDLADGDDSDPTLGPLDEYGYCTVINGAPVIAISSDKTVVNKEETVDFSDLSTNDPISWNWTFKGGNPSSSTSKTQTVTYSASGNYDVVLTVTNSKGTSTKTFTNYISVVEPVVEPVANFSSDKTTLYAGESVTFTDLSVNNPTSWNWTFQGGNPSSSTLQNPKVFYDTPGTYSVSLEVKNVAGSSSKAVSDYVRVNENIKLYCASSGTAANEWIESVQLGTNANNSTSSGDKGYEDFTGKSFTADAGSSLDIILQPGFSSPGKKESWNVWIDYNGDKDFDDYNELVFSSSASSKTVSGKITVPEGLNLTTRMRISMKRNSSPSPCEIFTFGEVEDYTISIVTPAPLPPMAEFSAVKTNVMVGESVQFTDLSENEPSWWEWSFPGGSPSTSNERNPVVSYAVPGQYDVSLTVSKPGFDPVKKVKEKFIESTEIVVSDYCVPGSINSSADYIQGVIIGSVLNNISAGNGYSIAVNPVIMAAGADYEITLTPAVSTNRNFWRIWIDFNDDGDFDDNGETLVTVNNKKGQVSTNITIPQNISGEKRMRIAMENSSGPNPCDDNYHGEVEDYTISFEPIAAQAGGVMTGISGSEDSFLFKVYPNPAFHNVNIYLRSVSKGDFYRLYNMNGEELIFGEILTTETKIALGNYPAGIYVIVVVNNDNVFNEKVIKH